MRSIIRVTEDAVYLTQARPVPMLSIASLMLVAYGNGLLKELWFLKEHKKIKRIQARLAENLALLAVDNNSRVNIGDSGECISRMILTFARISTLPDEWRPGESPFAHYVTVREFLEALLGVDVAKICLDRINGGRSKDGDNRDVGNGLINFHQWYRIGHNVNDGIEREFLVKAFQRLLAYIGYANGKGIDLMIPVILASSKELEDFLKDQPLGECDFTYIGISVKWKIDAFSIWDGVFSSSVLGTNHRCSLFNILMDLGTEEKFTTTAKRPAKEKIFKVAPHQQPTFQKETLNLKRKEMSSDAETLITADEPRESMDESSDSSIQTASESSRNRSVIANDSASTSRSVTSSDITTLALPLLESI